MAVGSVERHEGVGEAERGLLEGTARREEVFGFGVVSGVQEVGDALHFAVEVDVAFEDGAVLGALTERGRVVGEKPAADGALLRLTDGKGGALAKGLPHAGRRQESDFPADVAGDGVAGGENGLGDVGIS